ncbi:hypothetical protein AN643_03810 [Candidatus Epulonipiscioides saccharophilum]|nr:hypothetical protein AN643_03810 [Epulopiscium sp. SCG-B10WGA-EpuloB]
METLILGAQLLCTGMMGLYLFNQFNSNKEQCTQTTCETDNRKYEELQNMRKISLKEPLTEKMRPKGEDDIVGQTDAMLALKAALCSKNPQHVIIYGSPGVGKTAASRIALDIAKAQVNSAFRSDAKFIEIDATTLRFDDRSIADPLIGSVHDPIYQGAGQYGNSGVPNPKEGAVTKAHGGVLFIDEIGELHSIQMNKLLKVLEDRKVNLDSVYYNENDKNIPAHIHDIFQNGLPADFRLIGATTRDKSEIPPALRSRCIEISFQDLQYSHIVEILNKIIKREYIKVEDGVIEKIAQYVTNGRDAISILQMAMNRISLLNQDIITIKDIKWVIKSGGYTRVKAEKIQSKMHIGRVTGLYVTGLGSGGTVPIKCVVKKLDKGEGSIKISGIIEEEEIQRVNSSIKRKSMIKSSVDNIITVFKTLFDVKIEDYYIHITFPSNVPADGPSAGIAMFCAIYSALFNQPINSNIAMTGDLSIFGEVEAVGGIPSKIFAAKESGVKKIFIPQDNMSSTYNEYDDIEVCPVNNIYEVIEEIFTSMVIRKIN